MNASLPVLVVDDSSTIRMLVTKHLNGLGFAEVDHAEDGAAALERLRERQYELMISDWEMQPMGGEQLLKAVRANTKTFKLPVIMITATGSRGAEFAATLPASARVRGVTTKVFLKRFALAYLPRGIVQRRKRGLSVPLSAWLRGPLNDWATDRVGSERLAAMGVERRQSLSLLEEHRARKADHGRALWTLIVLSEWLEWIARRGPLVQRGGFLA